MTLSAERIEVEFSPSAAYQRELRRWVNEREYHVAITLAFNSPYVGLKSPDYCIKKLKNFDARANHMLLGKRWAKLHDVRIWAFYFLEKADVNPHWHGLLRFIPRPGVSALAQAQRLDQEATRLWCRIVPAGSVKVVTNYDQLGSVKYATKEIFKRCAQDVFVVPDQFRSGF